MAKKRKIDPNELKKWEALVKELAVEMKLEEPIWYNTGRILYNMKLHLQEYGLDVKGRGGRWKADVLDRFKMSESTARERVVAYQIKENIKPEKCFFLPTLRTMRRKRFSHNYGENNSAVSAPLVTESDARIDAAPEDKADGTPDKRQAIECIFVLTYQERLQFMAAVAKLGELRATMAMYSAVVREANGDAKGVGA